ncbi:MAG: aldo/keto reductase, partial [Candidatus Eremiobacteraeota bacterium]|nr:aldo/keto reductase [Candidatus Eremiobacteraeota bacterium]
MLSEVLFGRTGLRVSRLCAGTGSSGNGAESMQGRQAPQEYAEVLVRAFELGIRFWDTALLYGTHPHVRAALGRVDRRLVVVSSKTHAAQAERARADVGRCLDEMGLERLDIALMHEVDSLEQLEQRQPALAELERLRDQGKIAVVGLSTHSIDVLERVCGDLRYGCVFTNYNLANLHMDASMEDYEKALERAYASGQGVYVHKTLA